MKQGWEYKKLDACCEVEYGTRVVQKKDGGTIYPVYGGGGETFRMDRYNREDSIVVSRFAMSKTCVRFVQGKFFLNDSGLSVKAGEGILQEYLNHHLFFLNDSIYNLGKGAAQRNLEVKAFKQMILAIPPLSEQQSIVAELDKINEIIDLKKSQLKDLDLLAQSIFYDMFGDPIENPKGWEVKKLGEVCKLSQGLAINKQTKHYLSDIPTSIPLLRIKDMKDGTREIFVKEDDCPTSCMAYPDDIIYTRTGTLGLAFTNMYGIMHNNCFKIVTNEELVKVFFMNYIQGEWFKSNITRLASRSSQPDITHKLFLSQSIIVPPLSLQQSFASKIQSIESQKSAIKQSLADVETLLASRMDYYFN